MSLLIGKHINNVLSKDGKIVAKIDKRIYPLVIPEGAPKYPFIVHRSLDIQPEYTKDGANMDNVQVQVFIVGKKYKEAIEIAQLVRYDLEGISAEYEEFIVYESEVLSSSEDYLDEIDAYAITIVFNFKTNDK